ncbi:hypothetical protein CF149_18391 [Pseudomonas psychrophila]|nr:hypothetical protein CF149_18391 [Pseudomonas psychrophila]
MVVNAKLYNSFFVLSQAICQLDYGVKFRKRGGKLSHEKGTGQVLQGFAPFLVRHFYLLHGSKKVTKNFTIFFYQQHRGHL